jgi:uncharacterized protein YhaN
MADTLEKLLEQQRQAVEAIAVAMHGLAELRKRVGPLKHGGHGSLAEREEFDERVLAVVTSEKRTIGEVATTLGVTKRQAQLAMGRLVAKKLARKSRTGWGFRANV